MSQKKVTNILERNVIPIYFNGIKSSTGEVLNKEFLGTGTIIGSMGKQILVITASHLFKDLKISMNKLDKPAWREPFGLPDETYGKQTVSDIKQHDVTAFIKTDNGSEVMCTMDYIVSNHLKDADVAVLCMRIENSDYEHPIPNIKVKLKGAVKNEEVNVYAFSKASTAKIENIFETTKTVIDQKGSVDNEHEFKNTAFLNGKVFEINTPTDSGNSGGLVYQIDEDSASIIVCGVISGSDAEKTGDSKGSSYSYVSVISQVMSLKTPQNIPFTYQNKSINTELNHVLDFIVLGVIDVVEKRMFFINKESGTCISFIKSDGKISKMYT
jgi:hypothetical protein